ncbi:PAC2 family protein [Dehalococcoidia bacterium]|nr:PAC2 family protein [Dehalococcoidia bacterium]
MEIGAFKIEDLRDEIRQPHLFLTLRPWIDVGSVGTRSLNFLEQYLSSESLGSLEKPGSFYDFTRYRPQLRRVSGVRQVDLPNTTLRYAKGPGEHDFVFVHALEPHNQAETFIESLSELITSLKTSRYIQIGSMYGSSPHTRPLSVTGQATEKIVQDQLDGLMAIRPSRYEGPTSIIALLTEQLQSLDIDTLSMMVQLPPYIGLEEDRKGQETVLKLLDVLYKFSYDLSDVHRQGNMQYKEIEKAVQADPQTQSMVQRLEEAYDANTASSSSEKSELEEPSLSPEVEDFLKDLEQSRGDDDSPRSGM